MAWYPDLEPCGFFGEPAASVLRAVGWLERKKAFEKGQTSLVVYHQLKRLLAQPWQPFEHAGSHACTVCLFDGEASGGRNLFVPGESVIYVCPELILHYINAHGYHPPAEFCDAVMACPEPGTPEYRQMLLGAGGGVLLVAPPGD